MSDLRNSTAISNWAGLKNVRRSQRSKQDTSVWLMGDIESDLAAGEAGLIISNPMKISGEEITIGTSALDPSELRRALLFWDRIVWPSSSGIHFSSDTDCQFLESEGILSRPRFGMSGSVSSGMSKSYLLAFHLLEKAQPGQWVLSNASSELLSGQPRFTSTRGINARLLGAVPVPDREVPLEDILSFKLRNAPDLLQLRSAVDEFYQSWVNSEDSAHQFNLALRRIDKGCSDAIRLAKESKLRFSLASLTASFSVSGEDILRSALMVAGASSLGLPSVQAIGLGVASTISFGRDIGKKTPGDQIRPFNYVAKIEKKLW